MYNIHKYYSWMIELHHVISNILTYDIQLWLNYIMLYPIFSLTIHNYDWNQWSWIELFTDRNMGGCKWSVNFCITSRIVIVGPGVLSVSGNKECVWWTLGDRQEQQRVAVYSALNGLGGNRKTKYFVAHNGILAGKPVFHHGPAMSTDVLQGSHLALVSLKRYLKVYREFYANTLFVKLRV